MKLSLVSDELTFSAVTPDGLKPFAIRAYTGGTMRIPALPHPVVVDLEGLDLTRKSRPVLKDHNPALIVGHTSRAVVINGELHVEGVVSGAGEVAREVVDASRNGFPWQASIGVRPLRIEKVDRGKPGTANGRTFDGPVLIVRASRLNEVSFVALGADDDTAASIAASLGDPTMDEDRTDNQTDNQTDAPDVLAAERERIAAIERICAGAHPEIEATAIRDEWDAAKTELAVLRASRPAVRGVRSDRSREARQTLTAALCFSAGMSESAAARIFDERTIDAAQGRDYRSAGIHTLLYETINAAGLHARPGRVDDETIRTAFAADRQLSASYGFSSISLSGILGDVANRTLLAAYSAVNSAVSQIAAERDVNDFREHTSYRLTGKGTLERVGQDGELKHTTLTEQEFSNQVATYGRMIALTREMIVNDDLGAFLQIPRILGRQAALTREELVFSLLLSNPGSFFHADNGNFEDGADTALDIDSLTLAEAVFLEQTDTDGKPILVEPKILLVPPALKTIAHQLNAATTVVGSTDRLGNNPHAGKFTPVTSPYLSASTLSGSSAKAWYLFADPADLAAIEVAYLRGKRTPTIESGETSFNTLGMQWRCYWDLGVAMQDHRAAVKMKGEA